MRLRRTGVAYREIDGEMVVLDLTSSTYLTTNRTGATLLRLLAEERSTEDLVAALVDEFGVAPTVARGDVDAFVRALDDKGLLEGPSSGTPLPGGSHDGDRAP